MHATSTSQTIPSALPRVEETAPFRVPVYRFVTAAAISLNLWGWIVYGVWRLAS
ncbi:MAG: hypothetical protein HY270_02080 [Deltaproteobacteria bacterium]|nr:hypothetical protein [Deltaproteobacteria bacterium]